MGIVAFASLHGSPGVTTLGLAVAHHLEAAGRSTVFVEADPDGGIVAARHGISINPGLTELAGAARIGLAAADIGQFAQPLSSGVSVISASPIPERVHAALRTSGAHLANAFRGLSVTRDIAIDLGRYRQTDPTVELGAAADCLVFVARSSAEELVPLLNRLSGMPRDHVQIVLVGDHPYAAREVAQATGVTMIHQLPEDPRAVRSDPAATHRRGSWPLAVRRITQSIIGRFDELTVAAPLHIASRSGGSR